MGTGTLIIQPSGIAARSGPGKIGAPLYFPAHHKSLLNVVGLREWWYAPAGFGALAGTITWVGRKAGFRLVPDSSSVPSLATNIIGGKPAIQFGLLTRRVTDLIGNAIIPLTGDYSIVGAAKSDATNTGNWSVWGNAAAGASVDTMFRRTDQKISIYRAGSQVGVTAGSFTSTSAFFWVLSWEQAAGRLILRVNGAEVINVTGVGAVANSQIVVGAAQALPGSGGGGSGATPYGDYVSDFLSFSVPLAATAQAANLATVESYFTTEYGAVFA